MVALSGFAAHDSNCESLSREWLALTEKYGLTHMHTSAFLSGNNEYRKLGDPGHRAEILREFIMCARKYVELIVGVTVDASAIAKLKNYKPKISPLMFCFYRVVRMTVIRARAWRADDIPFAIVFDDSQEAIDWHKAMRELKRNRKEVKESVSAYSFADDRYIQCLQAADMFACLTTKEYRKAERQRWMTGPFRDLLLSPDRDFGTEPVSEAWTGADLDRAKIAQAMEPF